MKQAIPGVVPNEMAEVTVMTIWPSISVYASGRFLGRLYENNVGTYIFRIGNFLALASIPHALFLYIWRILPPRLFYILPLPGAGVRYLLTNRRLVVQRGLKPVDEKWVELDRFDSIDIRVQPGQAWFKSGDLIFKNGNVETFRLEGVSRPEVFRETCIQSHLAYVGVQAARQREAALA